MMMTSKHVLYHVHYHYLTRTPASRENNVGPRDCEDSFDSAGVPNKIPEQEVRYDTSYLLWYPELPENVSQCLFDTGLDGESILWSGKPNAAVLRKSAIQRGIMLVICLVLTFLIFWMCSWCLIVLEQTIPFEMFLGGFVFLCIDVWMFADFDKVYFYKRDYYVITPTRVIIFHGPLFYALQLKEVVFWKVDVEEKGIGTISLDKDIKSEFHWMLYQIDTIQYVKHLLLSLLAKSSSFNAEPIPNIPRPNYCPHCGCNLGEEMNSR